MSTIEKLREPKILDMAIFDWVATAAGAGILWKILDSKYPNKDYGWMEYICIFIVTVIFGIFSHILFKIDTKFGYYLGLNKDPRPKKENT